MESDIGSSLRGTSVPYGQACSGCSKAKCRCVKRGSGLDCDRCIRLKKECRPSNVVRKRPTQSGAKNKTKHLEEKLNDIITLLKSEAEPASLHGPRRLETHNSHNHPDLLPICGTSEQPESQSSRSTFGHPSPASTGGRNFDHAEEHLTTFKSFHLKHFPFVHIPDEIRLGCLIQMLCPICLPRSQCCSTSARAPVLMAKYLWDCLQINKRAEKNRKGDSRNYFPEVDSRYGAVYGTAIGSHHIPDMVGAIGCL
jgi:hypothetical protein